MATIVAVVVIRDCDQSAVSVGCYSAACAHVHAVAAGGWQSHLAGWLEQNLDVLAVSDAFGRFRQI